MGNELRTARRGPAAAGRRPRHVRLAVVEPDGLPPVVRRRGAGDPSCDRDGDRAADSAPRRDAQRRAGVRVVALDERAGRRWAPRARRADGRGRPPRPQRSRRLRPLATPSRSPTKACTSWPRRRSPTARRRRSTSTSAPSAGGWRRRSCASATCASPSSQPTTRRPSSASPRMSERSEPVLLDVSERIATVTLNRPDARNALSSEVLRLLPQLLDRRRHRRGRRRDHPHRRRPGVLRRPRPRGAGLGGRQPADRRSAGVPGPAKPRPVSAAEQAAGRGDQRSGSHRRVRAGVELRLPRGVGLRQVRRHPRPARPDAGVGHVGAPPAGDRSAAGLGR